MSEKADHSRRSENMSEKADHSRSENMSAHLLHAELDLSLHAVLLFSNGL